MGIVGISGLHRESRLPEGKEGLCEKDVGSLQRLHPGDPELLNQAVLEGTEKPLHTSLGLRAVSGDPFHPELEEGVAYIGQGFALNLLLHARQIVYE
jgi:hypothetical protein